jgi:transposase
MTAAPPIPEALWSQIPPAAQAAILALVQQYEQRLTVLQQQLDDLRQQLGQNSTNSSKPPSTDGPAVKRSPPEPASGRPRGGQPGHALHQRPLLPPDQTHTLKPFACRRCGQPLEGADEQPLRHQVLELPPIRPTVTEYQLHRLACPCCGTSTCAPLPAGVPVHRTGPRLQAAVAVLTGAYRLSKRQAEALCEDLFGVPLSAGAACDLEQHTSAALRPVVEPLREYVRTQPINMDETGWRENRQRGWLWAAVTAGVTLFHIARARSGAVVRRLLGPGFSWVLTSDRFSAYNWLAQRRRQVCWAHLKRDFQAMMDRGGAAREVGNTLMCLVQDVFTWWYRVRDGTPEPMSRATFQQYVGRLRPRFREALAEGARCPCARAAGTCREILKVERARWTFARVEGIEPTNNAAERALRHAVLWRKSSYGTDSEAGSRFVERVLSVVATCRQQGRNVLDYLTACCQAAADHATPPSLLPQPTQ